MIRFAEVFPDRKIVSALMTQLGWTHFLLIIPFDDPLKRDFYAEMCRIERWSTRTLQERIQSMLFERPQLFDQHLLRHADDALLQLACALRTLRQDVQDDRLPSTGEDAQRALDGQAREALDDLHLKH